MQTVLVCLVVGGQQQGMWPFSVGAGCITIPQLPRKVLTQFVGCYAFRAVSAVWSVGVGMSLAVVAAHITVAAVHKLALASFHVIRQLSYGEFFGLS